MKQKNCLNLFSILMISLSLLFSTFVVVPVVKADESTAVTRHPVAETNPLAVTKEGFFYGIDRGRIALADVDSGRKSSYRIEEDYRIFFENEEIPLAQIPPHSLVKLVLIEGQVREMILLLRSS